MEQIRIARPRPVRPRQTRIDTRTPSGRVLPTDQDGAMNKQGLGSPTRKLPQGSARATSASPRSATRPPPAWATAPTTAWRGWARLLAASMAAAHDVSFCNAAVPGATAAQVRTHQLAFALEHRPHLASLVVGSTTSACEQGCAGVPRDLLCCADRLSAQGAVLATVRFHDHGRVFGLPRPVRGFLTRRIDEVNSVYDEILARWDGIQLDLGAHPGIYDREFWCRDRLHPSELGHRAVAQECAELLRTRGLAFEGPALELDGDPTHLLRELRWAATEATPWLWRRAGDVEDWVVLHGGATAVFRVRSRWAKRWTLPRW